MLPEIQQLLPRSSELLGCPRPVRSPRIICSSRLGSLPRHGGAGRTGDAARGKERGVWRARTPASSPRGSKNCGAPVPVTTGTSAAPQSRRKEGRFSWVPHSRSGGLHSPLTACTWLSRAVRPWRSRSSPGAPGGSTPAVCDKRSCFITARLHASERARVCYLLL